MELHVTCRPNNLDDFIGNPSLKRTVKSMTDKNDIPHALLFTGPTGCGKTTLARIISDFLGCPPEPKNPDYIEIDIAQMGGIDNARDLRKQIPYKPITSKCRVWVLDEVHQGSKSFMNGMLKATEEIPEHTYFILCTTEPNSIIKTLRNRCTELKVSALQERQIVLLLENIADEIGIEIDSDVLKSIAKSSDGIPRRAIKMLDMIKHLDPNDMIKTIERQEKQEKIETNIARGLFNGDKWSSISKMIQTSEQGKAEAIRIGIMNYMKAIALSNKNVQRACAISKWFEDDFTRPDGMAKLTFACIEALKEE